MRRSQVAGMTHFKTRDVIRGHVKTFTVINTGPCPHCGAATEMLGQEVIVREQGLSTQEIFARLTSYGLVAKDQINKIIRGVDTPSESCCGQCQHTASSLI